MGILEGKRIVVTGVLTDQSIAFHVARLAQEEGARVVLTSFGRALSLTRRTASRLPAEAPVIAIFTAGSPARSTLVTCRSAAARLSAFRR